METRVKLKEERKIAWIWLWIAGALFFLIWLFFYQNWDDLSLIQWNILNSSTQDLLWTVKEVVAWNWIKIIEKILLAFLFWSLLSILILQLIFKIHDDSDDSSMDTEVSTKDKIKRNSIPDEVLETLTFFWVLSSILIAGFYIFYYFTNSELWLLENILKDWKLELSGQMVIILAKLSFFFAFLWWAVSNMKYFIEADFHKDRFNKDYIYRYVASPIIAIMVWIISYILLINYNIITETQSVWWGQIQSIEWITFIFLFFLFWYFNDSFFDILKSIMRSIKKFTTSELDHFHNMNKEFYNTKKKVEEINSEGK